MTLEVVKAENLKVGDCLLCGTHGIPSFNTVTAVVRNEEKKGVYVTVGQVSASQHYIETFALRFGQLVLNVREKP